jgi:hypothetical protein
VDHNENLPSSWDATVSSLFSALDVDGRLTWLRLMTKQGIEKLKALKGVRVEALE